jgi:CheY-like chemotaxis protein
MAKIDFDRLSFAVVDDNVHMRRLIRTLLYSFGSREIYEAEDGASGLEIVEMYSPDILITDWAMPIFDGLEFVQLIRNPDACKNAYIPIIMLTGHADRRRVLQARDSGVTEFLCKPVSATALYQRIKSIILNPRPFVRNGSYFGPEIRQPLNNAPGTKSRLQLAREKAAAHKVEKKKSGGSAGEPAADEADAAEGHESAVVEI